MIYLLIPKLIDHVVVLIEVSMQILAKFQVRKKASGKLSPLQQLQSMFSHKESAPRRML
jgi:cell division control protein 6